jgi:ASC-1-like (ASCH) protein
MLIGIKKRFFKQYKSGKKDVELRNVQPQWKNSRVGNEAVLQSGRNILRKRILKVHRGSLAEILQKVDYKRIFPDAENISEAQKKVKELYPQDEDFMAFELV